MYREPLWMVEVVARWSVVGGVVAVYDAHAPHAQGVNCQAR